MLNNVFKFVSSITDRYFAKLVKIILLWQLSNISFSALIYQMLNEMGVSLLSKKHKKLKYMYFNNKMD